MKANTNKAVATVKRLTLDKTTLKRLAVRTGIRTGANHAMSLTSDGGGSRGYEPIPPTAKCAHSAED